jgi:hypothetical protein
MTTNFFSPLSFVAVFGSGIRDPGWVKIRIRDIHPGSATLVKKPTWNYLHCPDHLRHRPPRLEHTGTGTDHTAAAGSAALTTPPLI